MRYDMIRCGYVRFDTVTSVFSLEKHKISIHRVSYRSRSKVQRSRSSLSWESYNRDISLLGSLTSIDSQLFKEYIQIRKIGSHIQLSFCVESARVLHVKKQFTLCQFYVKVSNSCNVIEQVKNKDSCTNTKHKCCFQFMVF